MSLGILRDRLERSSWSRPVEYEVPVAALTTYRVGGPAAVLVRVGVGDELDRLARCTAGLDIDMLVIGRGSNLLVADRGFDGLAVVLVDDSDDLVIDGCVLAAGGATLLPVAARRSVASGLVGFEWAVGVPGSVGGAVRMNAGGHGAEVADSLVDVEIVDLRTGDRRKVSSLSLDLEYRSSNVEAQQVIARARFGLAEARDEAERHDAEELLAEIVRWRREHQPGGQNAGSVFTNPPGDSAGRLIEVAGCKGLRVRSASVSEKHANFIQAEPDGSADDVFELMADVVRRVEAECGITLHPETRVVGFDA